MSPLPPLILLPGIEGDPRVFSRLAKLGTERQLLSLELPEGASVSEMAAALLSRHPEPFCVLGASLGGLVARAAAEADPRRVRALVAIGSLPGPTCRPPGLGLAATALRRAPAGWVESRYRRRIAARHLEEGVDPELSLPLLARLPSAALLARRLGAVASWAPGPPPPVPTLWLRGQVDTESPWTTAQAARLLPDAQVETVPGGHRPMLTHPEHLVAVVAGFLRGRG